MKWMACALVAAVFVFGCKKETAENVAVKEEKVVAVKALPIEKRVFEDRIQVQGTLCCGQLLLDRYRTAVGRAVHIGRDLCLPLSDRCHITFLIHGGYIGSCAEPVYRK